MSEFAMIDHYFAPLTRGAESICAGLTDDVAQLPASTAWVVNTDTIIEGIHYIGDEPPAFIAKKLLRCNLSDMAAKGAAPRYYTLNLTLGAQHDEAWIAAFCDGLAEDQAEYGVTLIGGDSTVMRGPGAVLSATMFGAPHQSGLPRRSGAKPGDVLCVSGTLGDAALGLMLLRPDLDTTRWSLSTEHKAALIARYHLPQPRVMFGQKIAPFMRASLDISDGLLQDAGHMASASGVGLDLYADQLPYHDAAKALMDAGHVTLEQVIAGGDDYEILMAMAPDQLEQAMHAAERCDTILTCIGKVDERAGVRLLDANGGAITLGQNGYQHCVS